MIKIALVGDIGSGKSYISKLFKAPIFDADKEVSFIYKRNKNCFKKIKKNLPGYFNKFPIKKSELVTSILDKKDNLKKISKIVHPIVGKKMKEFLRKNKNKKMIVLDIPLFLENKLNEKNDIIIFVQSKKKDIQKRLIKRKGYNYSLIKKLKKIQLPLEKKKKKSHFVIKNDFSMVSANNSVKNIIQKLLNERSNIRY